MKRTFIYLAVALTIVAVAVRAQEQGQHVRCIAFYNLENLFDTIHDEGKNDYDGRR